MKIVFFGASSFVLPIIEVLNKNFELALIVTTEKNESEAVISYCKSNKIPYLSVNDSKELKVSSKELAVAQMGVVADFGIIIPKEILSVFVHGILNIHPSLLPKYRGPTPVQTALFNGDTLTGVSIIKLDEHMDHGPILVQETEVISPEDTAQSLYEILFNKGAELLMESLNPYLKSEITLTEQKHEEATFTKMLDKDDGLIDLVSFPEKEKLENMIKAYFPWPGVWTKTNVDKAKEKIVKFLPGNSIQVEGKKPMPYKDFLNGYPHANSHLRLFLEKYV